MYPTFNVFIPVLSLSSCSNLDTKSLLPFLEDFNSSSSLLYPSFIKYPSFNVIGASSYIDFSSKSYKSLNSLILLKLIFFNISFILGNTFNEFFNCNKSLALAEPNATLPASLSRSYTSFKYSLNSSFKINSFIKVSIISYLCSIFSLSIIGFNI